MDYGGYGGGDGGGGAFGGGGFVNSPADGAGQNPSPGGRGGKGSRAEAVIPVTIKALNEAIGQAALDDQVVIWGAELGNVTLVAKILSVSDTATQVTYRVDDGTGKADLKMWVDNDDPEAAAQLKAELRPGSYARVFGSLRAFQGTKSLVAYSIRPVADHNEVTFHSLEVVYVSKQLLAKHGGAAGGARPGMGAGAGGGAAAGAPPANAGYGAYSSYAPPAAGGGGGGAVAVTGDVAGDVQKVFNLPVGRDEKGLSLATVAATLQGKYTAGAIRAAVEKLVNDGHLYSTVDDQHYKSTAF